MFVHVPYDGAKALTILAGVGKSSANYFGVVQVSVNALLIATGLLLEIQRKQQVVLPKGTKGLLLYFAISVPVVLYAPELYASREENPFLIVDGFWPLFPIAVNLAFPFLFLLGASGSLIYEFYGDPEPPRTAP